VINVLPNLKFLSPSVTKTLGDIKCRKIGWFPIVEGHSMSAERALFIRTLWVTFHINHVHILHRFGDIARY